MYNLYSYNKNEYFNLEINKEVLPGSIIKFNLFFDSPFTTGIKNNDSVYSEIFTSSKSISTHNNNYNKTINHNLKNPGIFDGKNFTLLILLHGFGSKLYGLGNYYSFIDNIIQKQMCCAFIHMPYHLSRTPEGQKSGEKLIYVDDAGTLEFYHQAVVDLRRLIDIAVYTFGFKKIVLCGFSLGSMVSVITTAMDSRILKTILIFGGGNWYHIHWNSALAHILKGNCIENGKISKGKCRDFYKVFPEFCREFDKTGINSQLKSDLMGNIDLEDKTVKLCFLCDPSAFGPKIDPAKILMLNSRFDHFFPRKSSIELWERLGRPQIHWFNSFHTSKILANKKALNLVSSFINNKS